MLGNVSKCLEMILNFWEMEMFGASLISIIVSPTVWRVTNIFHIVVIYNIYIHEVIAYIGTVGNAMLN